MQKFIGVALSPLRSQWPHVLLDVHTYSYVDVEVRVIECVVVFLQQCGGFGLANRSSSLHELIIEFVCRKELLAVGGDIVVHMPHA